MTEHRLEVADVVHQHQEEFLQRWGHTVSPQQHKALRDIDSCRTAALGGHVEQCDQCGHRLTGFNSCRNRHCPKCQFPARDKWLAKRARELLPVPYFHLVFTLPQQLAPLALQNPKVVYHLLLRATAETLLQIAADPRHLGAQLGFLTVLHTWGQDLHPHPHVHCVVPGGGLSAQGSRWISCRKNFFLPVRVLSRLFRGKFLALLQAAYRKGQLRLHGALAGWAEPSQFARLSQQLKKSDWVVYSKPPFGGPEQVLTYLSRYTHRVAISNSRLLSLRDGQVSFQWRDYRDGQTKVMTLSAIEFLRRFLQHILPAGFVKIRHFGFLANRCRRDKLAQCRELLSCIQDTPSVMPPCKAERVCPVCGAGILRVVEWFAAVSVLQAAELSQPVSLDSS